MVIQKMSFGVCMLFFAGRLTAQEKDTLDPRALVAEALQQNPEILAAQKRVQAARMRPSRVSSLPDPMISFASNGVGRPWPGAGLGTEPLANAGVMVSQEFPAPGKRKLLGGIAEREADAEFQQYQAAQLALVARVKQTYYRYGYAKAAADVMERSRELLTRLLRVAEARYTVGKAAQQDLLKAQTDLSILETKLVRMRLEADTRKAELLSLLGRAPRSPLADPPPLKPPLFTSTLDQLFAAAGRNAPSLGRERKIIQKTELAVNLARKEYYPDFTLSGGYFNMGGLSSMYMMRADVKLPLWYFRKQRAGVAESVYNLEQSRRVYESADQELHLRIQQDYLLANASARLVRLYGQTVVPQAALALESSLAAYETGAVDFLSVIANFNSTHEFEMNYYEEIQNLYLAVSRLEQWTGEELIP